VGDVGIASSGFLEVSDKVEFSSPPKKQLKEPVLAYWLFQFNKTILVLLLYK
jgi:hypothetical protein